MPTRRQKISSAIPVTTPSTGPSRRENGSTAASRAAHASSTQANTTSEPDTIDSLIGVGTRHQVVRSWYDGFRISLPALESRLNAQNMRGRIAATAWYDTEYNPDSLHLYDHAAFYSYDIRGAVVRFLRDIPALAIGGESGTQ